MAAPSDRSSPGGAAVTGTIAVVAVSAGARPAATTAGDPVSAAPFAAPAATGGIPAPASGAGSGGAGGRASTTGATCGAAASSARFAFSARHRRRRPAVPSTSTASRRTRSTTAPASHKSPGAISSPPGDGTARTADVAVVGIASSLFRCGHATGYGEHSMPDMLFTSKEEITSAQRGAAKTAPHHPPARASSLLLAPPTSTLTPLPLRGRGWERGRLLAPQPPPTPPISASNPRPPPPSTLHHATLPLGCYRALLARSPPASYAA